MTVLVCSHDAEPIDGSLRAEWMRACLSQSGYRIAHLHRDIPQTPEEHPEFWSIWREAIAEVHPEPIDWVFGSEVYIQRLAKEVSARPFLVDPKRQVVPVSATAIREDPWRHWSHVPGPVRGHYQHRLVLVGAESAGKTVLAETLAKRVNGTHIPEYGREYDANFLQGQGWCTADFVAIMDGHTALANAMAARSGQIVVEDTDAVQTLVWVEALVGKAETSLVARARAAVSGKTYLLLDHATPWHDDGTRYFADSARRALFTDRLTVWLDAFEADWRAISGPDWAARTAAAHSQLEHLVANPRRPEHQSQFDI